MRAASPNHNLEPGAELLMPGLKSGRVWLNSSAAMPTKDPRIDAYIAKSADFAKPILTHLRQLIHKACPDVAETIKWSVPFFDYKGTLCALPAFKQHCGLVLWKHALIFDKKSAAKQRTLLRRVTAMSDLPGDKILIGYLKKAVALNEAGVKEPVPAKPKAKKDLAMPDYFLTALKKNKKASIHFEKFSPSCQREYVEWLTEAKREETRVKRLTTALEWIARGKSRNWKYE